MKVTNAGYIGNANPHLSSDPSGQWPGNSQIEYLHYISLAVGAVNRRASNAYDVRRVSQSAEWRPPSIDPVDRIYSSFEGIPGGARLVNDDGDFDVMTGIPIVDEEFLDGRDQDGDGLVDEDYGAVGGQMFSWVMRDDTPAALANVPNEQHVPIVLECRQTAWAYSIRELENFNVVEYTIFNRSGHELDSMYVGFSVDMDAGPGTLANYYIDDQEAPTFPGGDFTETLELSNPLVTGLGCRTRPIRLRGFSVVDNDGDDGHAPGVASFLLFGHTVDPLGVKAPSRVGFHTFRSFLQGTPYSSKGAPGYDQQRYELMSLGEGANPETGEVVAIPKEQTGDYAAWASVGPFMQVPDGGSVSVTIGFAVAPGSYRSLVDYRKDYQLFLAGLIPQGQLFRMYPALEGAYVAQKAYEGIHERPRPGFQRLVPGCPGCETPAILPPGSRLTTLREQCGDAEPIYKVVTDTTYTWFNWDCDRCTGLPGYYLRRWNADTPPPSPFHNVSSTYNYADRPGRIVAAGDREVTVAWDNRSETTPDPLNEWFDFRSYQVWKAEGWMREAGVTMPKDEDWSLLGEFRMFDYRDSNFADPANCPKVFLPNYEYPAGHPHCDRNDNDAMRLSSGGCRDTATIAICLRRGDLWDRQNGVIIRPDPSIECLKDDLGNCRRVRGHPLGDFATWVYKPRYGVGRYRIVDREVKNGFVYFYSVTAGDSIDRGESFGRRAATEADAVVPQASTQPKGGAWVVPNPYRGVRNILERPSTWDLTPNSTDPTGTHIDFMGLPPGPWTIKIYTVAGDLVAELHSEDQVNESVRPPVVDERGNVGPGFNRQQDNPNDGQARWNLLSRNGQEVVSGIYVFVVSSQQGQQRGKFVVIR